MYQSQRAMNNMRRFNINNIFKNYTVKEITEVNAIEVYKVMENNPFYFENLKENASLEHVLNDIKALPPNKGYEDKYYFGLYKDNELICVIDLIDSFPTDKTAFLGFFMINKSYQSKGIGSSIIDALASYLKIFDIEYIRLGYVKTNNQSKAFWYKNKFKPTGVESKHNNYTIVFLERNLND